MPTSYSLDLRTRIAHDFNDNGNAEQVALSYRDVQELLHQCGIQVRHQTLRE